MTTIQRTHGRPKMKRGDPPSRRQAEVLAYIRSYIEENRYPPTVREISRNFDVWDNSARSIVEALSKKGMIEVNDMTARTIRVVHQSGHPACIYCGGLIPEDIGPGHRFAMTWRQEEVMSYVRERIALDGYPPAFREICIRFDVQLNSIQGVLRLMHKAGAVRLVPNIARGIVLGREEGNPSCPCCGAAPVAGAEPSA